MGSEGGVYRTKEVYRIRALCRQYDADALFPSAHHTSLLSFFFKLASGTSCGDDGVDMETWAVTKRGLQQKSYRELQQMAKQTGACKANIKFADMVECLAQFHLAHPAERTADGLEVSSSPTVKALHVQVKHLKVSHSVMFENPYLLSGYRANFGMSDCFWSMFQWHNDTVNVWSHLLGTILFISFVVIMIVQVGLGTGHSARPRKFTTVHALEREGGGGGAGTNA